MLPVFFLLPFMNISNQIPMLEVVVTGMFLSSMSRVAAPNLNIPDPYIGITG